MSIGSIFSGVGDLFSAQGDFAAAKLDKQAAQIGQEEEQLEKSSTALQESAQNRQNYQVIGSQIASVGGAGFSESGSGLDLLRSSQAQGAIKEQLIGVQGQIQVEGTKLQVVSAEAQAAAAEAAGQASQSSGFGSILGGIGSLIFSDRRLKFAICPIGMWPNGLTLYRFRFWWKPWRKRYGFMAHEVERIHPEAVWTNRWGFKLVNYEIAVR